MPQRTHFKPLFYSLSNFIASYCAALHCHNIVLFWKVSCGCSAPIVMHYVNKHGCRKQGDGEREKFEKSARVVPHEIYYFSIFFLRRININTFKHFQNTMAELRGEAKFWGRTYRRWILVSEPVHQPTLGCDAQASKAYTKEERIRCYNNKTALKL